MVLQTGRYQVGFETDGDRMYEGFTAIYKDNHMLCSFPNNEAEEIAGLMCSWLNLNILSKFTDEQLIEELRNRNYSGALNKKFEV